MWANTTTSRGIISDEYGFTLLSFSRLIHTGHNDDDEPYIKASKAQMMYYVGDEFDKNWCIPAHLKPRDLYNMVEDDVDNFQDVEENIQLIRSFYYFILIYYPSTLNLMCLPYYL